MYRSLTALLEPYTLVYLLTALAIANLWRKRRETRRRLLVLTGLFAVLTALSTPAVGSLALRTLEGEFAPLEQKPTDVSTIVVLSGGVRMPDGEGRPAQMDSGTIERCCHAAELYRRWPGCRILASGGKVDPDLPGPAYAEVMRDFLLELNVPASDVAVENTSPTTYKNAVECRKLLEQQGVRKIILVTDAVHMKRARACFEKQGLEVVPAPCHFQAARLEGSLRDYLPHPDAVQSCREAAHEWIGMAWYRLQGRE
jgi:uncharacterized SAM-binding protein YcdF (DUF218 family)